MEFHFSDVAVPDFLHYPVWEPKQIEVNSSKSLHWGSVEVSMYSTLVNRVDECLDVLNTWFESWLGLKTMSLRGSLKEILKLPGPFSSPGIH